jgi:hypothetical protein
MTAVVAALITGVVGGMLTGYFAPRWKAESDRRAAARDLEIRYSAALLRAAHELQSRLYNLLAKDFRSYLDGEMEHRRYAELSTLWLVGQFFCWLEIMRREAHYLLVSRRGADGNERLDCMGYAEFTRRLSAEDELRAWFDRLSTDLRGLASAPQYSSRIVRVQHGLVDLVNYIDPDRERMPEQHARREKLPDRQADETATKPRRGGSAF